MQVAQRIDLLNIVLMLAAFVFALLIPFEAFLFSYAVLGPLHYMTEISWLNQRDFFLKKRKHAVFLIVACFLLSAHAIYVTLYGHSFIDGAMRLFQHKISVATIFAIEIGLGALSFVTFFITLAFNKVDKRHEFFSWLALIVFIALLAQFILPAQYALFSLMLPTIIHVSLFTALFILSGALKQNSVSGYAVFILYVVTCILFFMPNVFLPVAHNISDYALRNYAVSGFTHINHALLSLSNLSNQPENSIDVFRHPFGLRIQAFIAFAYTYHYLNWFSKTGLVGWHRISRGRLAFIIAAWLGCVGVYAYDYRLGLAVLLFFSLLHVVLEFPLNHKVTGQIMLDLAKRLDFRRHNA
jgi:hypothetical protein